MMDAEPPNTELNQSGRHGTKPWDVPWSNRAFEWVALLEDIEKWAAVLRDVLSRNSTNLPKRYLIQRFIRLVPEQWKLSFNPNVVLERLDTHWGGYNEFTGDWNT